MGAPKHPKHSFSLDSKTLFGSQEDLENFDITRDKLWKDSKFLRCVKTLSKQLPLPRWKLNELSKNLNPVELQLQTMFEILCSQKLHCTDPVNYDKATSTKHYFMKSLGLDLSLQLDQLIDDSNTSFEHGKTPEHWTSILPARSIWANNTLESNFNKLVTNSFKLLHRHWQKRGLLTESGDVVEDVKPKYHTIAKNTLGKNIGAKSTPYLVFSQGCDFMKMLRYKFTNQIEPFEVQKEQNDVTYVPNNIPSIWFLYKVKKTLNKYVVRNVFSKEQIREMRNRLYLKSTLARENAFKIIEVDPNVSALKFSRGRINCVLRGTTFNESLSPLQSFWMPFVYYFMKNDRKIFLSNVQLISSDSMSYVEPWHRDNKNPGISVVVPLQDTNKHNGRMQFIPGTHNDLIKVNSYKIGRFRGVTVFRACWNRLKGGRCANIQLYDTTQEYKYVELVSTCLVNESDVCQSMLVFTYDHVDTPPPGQGLLKFMLDNFHGNAIVNLNKLFM